MQPVAFAHSIETQRDPGKSFLGTLFSTAPRSGALVTKFERKTMNIDETVHVAANIQTPMSKDVYPMADISI